MVDIDHVEHTSATLEAYVGIVSLLLTNLLRAKGVHPKLYTERGVPTIWSQEIDLSVVELHDPQEVAESLAHPFLHEGVFTFGLLPISPNTVGYVQGDVIPVRGTIEWRDEEPFFQLDVITVVPFGFKIDS